MDPTRSGADDDRVSGVELLPGFTNTSYGAGFADVYDAWYGEVSAVGATVELLADLAAGGQVLELGVGTGRLAIPLAAKIAPVPVWGIDTSPEMLLACQTNDVEDRVIRVLGDMAADLPPEPFSLVFVAYNTLFNLADEHIQQQCFHRVAERLGADGRFVIEAFVPDDPDVSTSDDHADVADVERVDDVDDVARVDDGHQSTGREQQIAVRSMTATEVVLAVSRHDPAQQRAGGQFIELRDGEPVRLRPWSIRYATPAQLDAMAAAAGLELEHRWADVDRSPFTDESARHVSVYRTRQRTSG